MIFANGCTHCSTTRESTGMVMHKDSKWAQSWQNFKDNNQYVHSKLTMTSLHLTLLSISHDALNERVADRGLKFENIDIGRSSTNDGQSSLFFFVGSEAQVKGLKCT